MRQVTAQEVKELREATGHSMMTCKNHIQEEIIIEAIQAKEDVYEILMAIMMLDRP